MKSLLCTLLCFPAICLTMNGCVKSSEDQKDIQGDGSEVKAVEVAKATPAKPLAPFTQKIAGTSVELEMIPIPAGPDTAPFYASSTEQTWDIYDVFIFNLDGMEGFSTPESDAITRPSKPYVMTDRGYGHQGYAFLSATPAAAKKFVEWISEKTGRTYRIPTIAEQRFMLEKSGVTAENLQEFAWVQDNADWTTHPVGSKPADALGLHDLWGNLAEYAVNPDGTYVVVGGSWIDPAEEVTMEYEKPFTTDWNADDPQIPKSIWWMASNDWVGIRLVCDPE